MVIREKDNWLRLLFTWHGSVLPRLLLVPALYGAVVAAHAQRSLSACQVPQRAAPVYTVYSFITRWVFW